MRVFRAAAGAALLLANAGVLAEPPSAQPFIERTLVVAPKRVGALVLEGSRYDPAKRTLGVTLRYALPEADGLAIDLFVYPVGHGDTGTLLDRGMRDFVASVEAAGQAGYYRNLTVGEVEEFDVPLPAPGDTPPDTAIDDPAEARRAAMLAEFLEADRRVVGRKMALDYESSAQAEGRWLPMHSRGFLFHRHLYYFKGRVSVAADRLDGALFDEFSERVMRQLVPAVQAFNIGSCDDRTLGIDPAVPQDELADALMRGMLALRARREADNCHASPDQATLDALARDAEVVAVEYGADDWRTD